MKNQFLLMLSLFFYFEFGTEIKSQGGWISQELQLTMKGTHLASTASDCLIHTKADSRYVYIFDIGKKKWTEVDLGSRQNIKAVDAGNHVVFAYSDSLLIAYSSLTSTNSVTGYSGNIISPQGTKAGSRGYGCGDKAVYVWTDQNILYVFDGLTGEWKWFDYGETENATGASNFWCGDNYVAGIFHRSYPDKHKNVVYSLVTGTFNKTENGGVYYSSSGGTSMTGGFVSTYGESADMVLLAGYSAYTNQFYIIEEYKPYIYLFLGNWDENWINLKRRNVYGYNIMRGDDQTREVTINTFDTKKASWFTHSFSFQTNEMESLSTLRVGGNTSICSISGKDGSVTFYIYSGETGSYHISQPGIYFNLQSYYFNTGNTFSSALDRWSNAWFKNTRTGFSQLITFNEGEFGNIAFSSDYISFCQYGSSQSAMDIWFYNSITDRSSKININKDVYPHFSFSPYSYIFMPASPENTAVFYSAVKDSIIPFSTLLADNNSTYGTEGIFSWLQNSTSCLIFDAANLRLLELNTKPINYGISDSLILFRSGNIYDVYDASNGILTSSFDLGGIAGLNYNGGNILLIANNNYSKYYVFQKTKTEWTELIPEGNHVFEYTGKNVALVARSTKLYAFVPEGFTKIKDENIIPVSNFLFQNYPNPFNASTIISWRSAAAGRHTLKIFDILGNEIATLVDEFRPAGNHRVDFNYFPSLFRGLASGVYFYQLRIGNYIQTKKMILMK